MVFSSVPVYLDPPNWQQQQGVGVGGGGLDGSQLPPPPPPPTGTTIRPNSMAERARMAKIPQPEAALKCPRCESTNTKFCYFNNYSLSQPRHFCKTCRRYWTRGGALRSVPVGGGCRRNKRSSKRRSSSSSRSKSPAVLTDQSQAEATATAAAGGSSSSSALMPNLQQQMTMFPSLHHLTDYNSGDIGLNFTGIQSQGGGSDAGIGFQVASTGGSILPSNGLVEQWKLQQQVQQFPFFSAANGLYSFDPDQAQSYSNIIKPAMALDSAQVANVKMEESGTKQRLNFSRNFLGSINNLSANDHHHQYWGASNSNNAWTDLSGFTSSSTSHLL